MRAILLRSGIITVFCILASMLIVEATALATGASASPYSLMMCVLCPLLLAGPVSFGAMMRKRDSLAGHAALDALRAELAEARAELQRKSRRDVMTGLLTREAWLEKAEAGVASGRAVLVADIDRFAEFCEAAGLQGADGALYDVARAVSAAAGERAVAGRIGDDTFAVLLTVTGQSELRITADRIRDAVNRLAHPAPKGTKLRLSVSVGGAIAASGDSAEMLLANASRQLREAKARGRNLTVVDEDYCQAA